MPGSSQCVSLAAVALTSLVTFGAHAAPVTATCPAGYTMHPRLNLCVTAPTCAEGATLHPRLHLCVATPTFDLDRLGTRVCIAASELRTGVSNMTHRLVSKDGPNSARSGLRPRHKGDNRSIRASRPNQGITSYVPGILQSVCCDLGQWRGDGRARS